MIGLFLLFVLGPVDGMGLIGSCLVIYGGFLEMLSWNWWLKEWAVGPALTLGLLGYWSGFSYLAGCVGFISMAIFGHLLEFILEFIMMFSCAF